MQTIGHLHLLQFCIRALGLEVSTLFFHIMQERVFILITMARDNIERMNLMLIISC